MGVHTMEENNEYRVIFDDDLPAYTIIFTHKGTRYLANLGWTYFMPSPPTMQTINDEEWCRAFANNRKAELMIFLAGDDDEPASMDNLYEAICKDVCEEEIRSHVDKFIQKLNAEQA